MRMQTIFSLALIAALLASVPTAQADRVNWSPDVDTAFRSASQSGRPLLMKFTADWCGYCKKMERETFTRPAVASLVNQRFIPVLIDADKHQDLVRHLKIKGLPALLVMSPEAVVLTRISGFQTEEKLLPKLQTVLAQQSNGQSQQVPVAGSSKFAPNPTRPVSRQTASVPPVTASQSASHTAALAKPAFGGLCLPAVNESRSLVSGRPDFTMPYRGKTLYFSTLAHKEKFLTAPSKYWPALDGACPVTLAETGKIVEGKLEYAAMFRGKLWATDSPTAMQKFVQQPAAIVDKIQKQQ